MASDERGRKGRSGSGKGARPAGRPDMRRPAAPGAGASGKAEKPLPQVGKRPSPPGLLLVIGAIWLAVGVVLLFTLHWSWKLVPVVLAIGIGGLYVRGGLTALARRDDGS